MFRRFLHFSFLALLLLTPIETILGQEINDTVYEEGAQSVRLTVKMGAGPAYLAIDYGYLIQNQFELELGKHFSFSASYGTAYAYEGLRNVQRWYFPPITEYAEDDRLRHQSLFFATLGLQLVPLNREHHRLYLGMGPSLNVYNWSKAQLETHADSTAFVITNSSTTTITYSFFAGYDLMLGKHFVLGLSFYHAKFTEAVYTAILSAGYRF